MILFILSLIVATEAINFAITKNAYNGSITLNGLVTACKKEYSSWKPCTKIQLYDNSWNQNIPPSWFLGLDTPNCIGFTTDSEDAGGQIYSSKLGYIEWVSCNDYFAVCCYY